MVELVAVVLVGMLVGRFVAWFDESGWLIGLVFFMLVGVLIGCPIAWMDQWPIWWLGHY